MEKDKSKSKIINLNDLVYINARVRGIDQATHDLDGAGQVNETGMTFSVLEYLPPLPENRKGLLVDILENAKLIEDKQSRATFIGLCVNAIHPFNDGNGRTSRYAYFYTLYDGQIPKDIEEEILVNTEGRKIVDLNPQRVGIKKMFNDYMLDNYFTDLDADITIPSRLYGGFEAGPIDDYSAETVTAPAGCSREMKQALYDIYSDRFCGLATVVSFLIATNKENLLTEYTKQSKNNGSFLNLGELAPEITDDDITLLYDTHVRVRDEYIQFIKKIFLMPEYDAFKQYIMEFYRPKIPEDVQA